MNQTKREFGFVNFSIKSLLLVTLLAAVFFAGRESATPSLKRMEAENRMLQAQMEVQEAVHRDSLQMAQVKILEAESKHLENEVEKQRQSVQEIENQINERRKEALSR